MILLRSALFNLWFYGVTLVLALVSPAFRLLPPRRAMDLARCWSRLALGGLGPLCGIRVAVSGREHLPPAGPALIASQHQSAFDTMIWLLLVPDAAYVLKHELLRIPLFGPMCRRAGMIAVDRSAGAAAIRSLLRDGAAAAAAGRQIVIFPEGTRTPPGTVRPLQPGIAALAARTGLPVIPVLTNSGAHWGRRAFSRRPGTIRIAIQAPLPAELGREALMARLRDLYAEAPQRLAVAVDKSGGGLPAAFTAGPSSAE